MLLQEENYLDLKIPFFVLYLLFLTIIVFWYVKSVYLEPEG